MSAKTYLKSKWEIHQKQSTKTFREIAKIAGCSHSHLYSIICGNGKVSGAMALKIAQALNFTSSEKKILINLLETEDTPGAPDKDLLKKLLRLAKIDQVLEFSVEQLQLFSKWYFPVIIQLTKLTDFEGRGEWISNKLGGLVTPEQAEEALRILNKHGVIIRTGFQSFTKPNNPMEMRAPSAYVREFLKTMFRKGIDALDQPVETRVMESITIAIPKSELPEIRAKIMELKRELNQFLSTYENCDSVYQFNLQFFDLLEEKKMKNQILVWIIFLTTQAALAAGGTGASGGKPMILAQVSLKQEISELADHVKSFTLSNWLRRNADKIVSFEGDCKIIDINSSGQPVRIWALQLNAGKILLDKNFFNLSRGEKLQVLRDVSQGQFDLDKVSTESLNLEEIPKNGKTAAALSNIQKQLTKPFWDQWMIDSYNKEMQVSKFYKIPSPCFVTRDNQEELILAENNLVSVRGFTEAKSGAPIYFTSAISDYDDLDTVQIIAAELGHHLPIGQEAKNEDIVNSLASIFVFGTQSVESKAIMFDLKPKLFAYHLVLERIKIPLPQQSVQTPAATVSKPKSDLDKTKEATKPAALPVLNGFNNLLGSTKMTSMNDCAMSYWIYSTVTYDRDVLRTFEKREPTEMEEIMLNLYYLNHSFCSIIKSLDFQAELSCLTLNKVFVPTPFEGKHISQKKLEQLSQLDKDIHHFKLTYCANLEKGYSLARPFDGTETDRKLLLAVEAGNSKKVETYLNWGGNPDFRDIRLKERGFNEQSLLHIAFSQGYYRNVNSKQYLDVIRVLLQGGANPDVLMDSFLTHLSYAAHPLKTRTAYPYLEAVQKYSKVKVHLANKIDSYTICDDELMDVLYQISDDIQDENTVINRYHGGRDERKSIKEYRKGCSEKRAYYEKKSD